MSVVVGPPTGDLASTQYSAGVVSPAATESNGPVWDAVSPCPFSPQQATEPSCSMPQECQGPTPIDEKVSAEVLRPHDNASQHITAPPRFNPQLCWYPVPTPVKSPIGESPVHHRYCPNKLRKRRHYAARMKATSTNSFEHGVVGRKCLVIRLLPHKRSSVLAYGASMLKTG